MAIKLGDTILAAHLLSMWHDPNETWIYASADDPTFTFTVTGDKTAIFYPGMRIKLTQTTVKYFIITKVAYADPTSTITIYGGTDYDLANAAITNNFISGAKAPAGFPLNPDKWTAEITDITQRNQLTPSANTWYNIQSFSIDIPIGIWDVEYSVALHPYDTGANAQWGGKSTLSTANNSESDVDFTTYSLWSDSSNQVGMHQRRKILNLAAKTTYYFNHLVEQANLDGLYLDNHNSKMIIRTICAYL